MFYLLILGAVCHCASVEVRGQLAESVLSFYNVKYWHQIQVISLGEKRHLAGLEKGHLCLFGPDSASQAVVDD